MTEELLWELKRAYGDKAEFREGQLEAIQGVLEGRRALVVQKTGWGKSLVYFLATKILRKRYNCITLIISPLLVLMNNQIESAAKLGLHVETINSSNTEIWETIIEAVINNEVDALIISPERLANEEFSKLLREKIAAKIGLFVVDEAHCISDWGHDFRPDYRRITDIIDLLPANIPVLATTATANNRVVQDIKAQLGDDLLISRGSLIRQSLAIQVIELYTKEARLAWILKNIDALPGTGIIYCLTVADCILLNKWLNKNGILSESYYAGIEKNENKNKNDIVNVFVNNQIKVLVATVAFGMGFDKPDIGFIIHFQKPANIVAYYQQIGRAGRNIDQALAILLRGGEDDEINEYFIESAFPTEELMNEVVGTIYAHQGLRISEIEKYINMKPAKIKNCVNYLLVNGDIYSENGKYFKAPRPWKPDLEKSRAITELREDELRQIEDFTKTTECYMKYIANALDDFNAKKCGRCANCLGRELISSEVPEALILKAQQFIRQDFNIIEPRKKWPAGVRIDNHNKIQESLLCETGRVLSNYGDAGWGKLVSAGKYKDGFLSDELVDASYVLLKEFVVEHDIKWITNISSKRRPELVKSFAERLADRLGLQYLDVIEKVKDVKCQKELNTSYLQCSNAYESFEVRQTLNENVLLVDDMVDSRWTFTVCGYKLRMNGSGNVFPFALANSAGRNGDK